MREQYRITVRYRYGVVTEIIETKTESPVLFILGNESGNPFGMLWDDEVVFNHVDSRLPLDFAFVLTG